MARAHEWANTSPSPDLTTREHQFLEASRATQAAEQAMARRRSRRLRRLIALLAVLLLLTASATVYAIRAQGISARQHNTAIIAEAVNRIAILNGAPNYNKRQLALALSLAAHNLDPNPHTRGGLINSYTGVCAPATKPGCVGRLQPGRAHPRDHQYRRGHPVLGRRRPAAATASGGYDRYYTRLWEIDVERIKARACEDPTVPAITPGEWERYFPGLPFRSPCP
jgi:hypothetical protein